MNATLSGEVLHGMDVALGQARAKGPNPPPKDVVAMSLTRQPIPAKLTRPARPHCRGGASSLLRLAQPAAPRLPAPLDLTDWLRRAASAFSRSTALAGR